MNTQDAIDEEHDVSIWTLQSLPSDQAEHVLGQLRSIERKTFPSHEAFDLSTTNLYRPNTQVFCAIKNGKNGVVIAYAICVRSRRVLWLHKICVAEPFRTQGIGKLLLKRVQDRARAEKCRQVELWVDESRVIARALYSNCGFSDRRRAMDYYAPGRHAINMTWEL